MLISALGMRLVNLDAYTGKFDEGIRLEQLLLMRAGFRPVTDIFAAQGPLSLDLFYGPYILLGQNLAAARSTVVLCSLLGLLVVYLTAVEVGGRAAGLVALVVLVLSPLYLKNSRLALLEVPALVPATAGLGLALRHLREPRAAWVVGSAILVALGLLIKPISVGVLAPIGLLLLVQSRQRWWYLLLYGLVGLIVVVAVSAVYGLEPVWQQVVVFHGATRASSEWSLKENWLILIQELRDEPIAIYALALVLAPGLCLDRSRRGLALALWPIINLALLLLYSPLQFKHVVILLPPLALLVGAGLARLGRLGLIAFQRADRRALLPLLLLGGLCTWYLSGLPASVRLLGRVMDGTAETRPESYAVESRLIEGTTRPDQFVLADDPIVAYSAGRLVPPALVDTSSYRVRSGSLSGSDAVAALERYDVRALFLFSDGLRELKRFEDVVDSRFRAIWIAERQNGKDRAVYLRDDADFEHAREQVSLELRPISSAEFGGDLRLVGYNLTRDELRAGSSTGLTLHWEALRQMTSDYHVLARLRSADGQPAVQTEKGLGGGGEGTSSWEPGRWVVRGQILPLPPRLPPGDYQLSVSVYDSKARRAVALSSRSAIDGIEQPLAVLSVR